ncbi:serine/threonine-protein kinase [Nannocystis sp.]|uniref:serine/threonine-protein kinase n=1 Tax=Nannocystis sp. TaxID=1962667 RepID=UPI0025D842B8|nr:serine/threonine-protein kinase [Nannocystis sp.]MBK7827223.1 serine/threonine protein kinase [Nannocystis sp.]
MSARARRCARRHDPRASWVRACWCRVPTMTATSIEMRDTVAASDPGDVRTAFEFTRGTLINRYVVLERLGAGGMSIVYAAYDPELRRRVALQLLLFDAEGADQVRMLREARAIARLSHPNVITVFDVGTFEGRIYITMEYVDGQTMRDWWASAPRGWSETLAVFLDAARGLSAAHAAGLIHRDFKPENVLIGKDGRVRVLDFGLARRVPTVASAGEMPTARSYESVAIPGTDVFRIDISRVGAVVGTPAYMAPGGWLARRSIIVLISFRSAWPFSRVCSGIDRTTGTTRPSC